MTARVSALAWRLVTASLLSPLVIIDRRSEWGNPYKPKGNSIDKVYTCIQKYAQWLDSRHYLKKRIPKELKGKVLACWCKKDRKGISAALQPCHGDVLSAIANSVLE